MLYHRKSGNIIINNIKLYKNNIKQSEPLVLAVTNSIETSASCLKVSGWPSPDLTLLYLQKYTQGVLEIESTYSGKSCLESYLVLNANQIVRSSWFPVNLIMAWKGELQAMTTLR